MKILILTLVFLIHNSEKTELDTFCECSTLNSKTISALKTKSDLIAIGKPTKVLKGETAFDEDLIIFEIDSLVKGDEAIQSVLINQNRAGNCAQYFKLGTSYLITGDEIKNIKSTYGMGQTEHSDQLEKLVNEYYTVSTNGCRSFKLKSRNGEEFLSSPN